MKRKRKANKGRQASLSRWSAPAKAKQRRKAKRQPRTKSGRFRAWGSKPQTKRGRRQDTRRKAKAPGKRKSRSGRRYYEYRRNRAD